MTKYFNIALPGATTEQERAVAAAWKGYGWWHGVPGFWMLRDHTDQMSAASVRDEIIKHAPGATLMVVEMQPVTWASATLHETNREWLRNYWPPEGS